MEQIGIEKEIDKVQKMIKDFFSHQKSKETT